MGGKKIKKILIPLIMEPEKIPSDVKAAYKVEFERGVKLFQDSLAEYEKAGDFAKKKEMLKDVMDKALDVINEAARGFLSKTEAKEQKEKLLSDYAAFLKYGDTDTYAKLNQDVERLKGMA